MRKLDKMLIASLMAAGSMTASAVTFTMNVNDATGLSCTISAFMSPSVEKEMVTGENIFDVAEYSQVKVTATSPYYIESVTTTQEGVYPPSVSNNEISFYVYSSQEGNVYDVNVINLDELRTASCTLTVDDPSMVRAVLGGTNAALDLQAGEQTLKFAPEFETTLQLESTAYGRPLYQVLLDGEPLVANYGTYTVPLTQGCSVDIQAKYPDKDVTVTFEYPNEGTQGAISNVTVNSEPLVDFDGISFTAKAGDRIGISQNYDYQIENVKIDGSRIAWTGGYEYSWTIADNCTVEVVAHKYATIPVTVKVDDPSRMILYRGYTYENKVIELSGTENVVEVRENYPVLSWKASPNCYIEEVLVNGETYTKTDVEVKEGMTIEFYTGEIVLDNTAVIWIDDKSAADYYFNFESSTRDSYGDQFNSGYNVLDFAGSYNPFQMSGYGTNPFVNKVYNNGELVSPRYEGSFNYEMTLADGDVLKVFLANQPVDCSVNFDVEEGANANVVRDLIVTVDDLEQPLNVFAGTQMRVSAAEGASIKVSVNGVALTKDEEDGENFTFLVNDPATTVKIEKGSQSGINSIDTEAAVCAPVFNLQGVKMGTSLDRLPAGVYIRDGKKVVVK